MITSVSKLTDTVQHKTSNRITSNKDNTDYNNNKCTKSQLYEYY